MGDTSAQAECDNACPKRNKMQKINTQCSALFVWTVRILKVFMSELTALNQRNKEWWVLTVLVLLFFEFLLFV